MAKEDVDFVDTESAGDNEAALKCDACGIVAEKVSHFSVWHEILVNLLCLLSG